MKTTRTALILTVLVVAGLGGCAKRLPPGVLEGGAHVPPPPSEQHRLESRVAAPAVPADAPAAGGGLRAPASR